MTTHDNVESVLKQNQIAGPGDNEPQFEEDEDGNCVIRITPKPVLPIKLKIKPIMRPELDEQPNPPPIQ